MTRVTVTRQEKHPRARLPEVNTSDPLEMMLWAAIARRAGWTIQGDRAVGFAIMPETAKSADEWAASSAEMHRDQRTLVLSVTEKPAENIFAHRTKRVAELLDPGSAPPEIYADSDACKIARGEMAAPPPFDPHADRSAEHPSKTKRGD